MYWQKDRADCPGTGMTEAIVSGQKDEKLFYGFLKGAFWVILDFGQLL
jgi:hypothetical protein